MKVHMDNLISPNQTAFVKGRWINENSLLAQEMIHVMNKNRAGRGFIGLKIDFSKAFDKIDWNFLQTVL